MAYEPHPAADAFPMMDDGRFNELVDDIRTNGLIEHIVIYDGKILDGRNRYKACLLLEIQPKTKQYDGDDPWSFVWSLNGARRDLVDEQRYLIWKHCNEKSEAFQAEKKRIQDEANAKRAEAARVQENRGNRYTEPKEKVEVVQQSVVTPLKNHRKGQQAKSKAAKVNPGAVARGDKLVKKRPDLAEKVRTGAIRPAEAHRQMKKEDLEEKKAKAAAQLKEKPDAPKVWCESYKTWLEKQPDCDLLLTDPPYSTDVEDIATFAEDWLPMALSKVKKTGRAYVFIGAYPEEIQAYLNIKIPTQILVWTYRNTLGPSPKKDYKLNWQAILYYRMQDAHDLDCEIMLEQFSVQDISAPDGRQMDRYHTWQKPNEIAERFVRHSTVQGEVVIDPFCCTGTFPLAAARLGRIGLGCDINIENLKIAEGRGCVLM